MQKLLPLLISLMLFSALSFSLAITTQEVYVQYERESGWSERFLREVDFLTGRELNTAIKTTTFNMMDLYALVWFDDDKVAILEYDGVAISTGLEYTASNFRTTFFTSDFTHVNGNSDTKWKITKPLGTTVPTTPSLTTPSTSSGRMSLSVDDADLDCRESFTGNHYSSCDLRIRYTVNYTGSDSPTANIKCDAEIEYESGKSSFSSFGKSKTASGRSTSLLSLASTTGYVNLNFMFTSFDDAVSVSLEDAGCEVTRF